MEDSVMLVVEKLTRKVELEISLKELVDFLVGDKVLKAETAKTLLAIMPLRNSVHLRQKISTPCTVDDVENALEFLVYVITHAPKSLK